MAEKRMLSKKITDNDNFIGMPAPAQALYLHLSMSADDEGFCNQVSLSMFKAHASEEDLKVLIDKKYIYMFKSGVVVIKHWKMSNSLRKERMKPTAFQEEKSLLKTQENQAYTWIKKDMSDKCQPNVRQMSDKCQPNVRLDKYRLDKNSIDKNSIGESIEPSAPPSPKKHKYGEYNHVLLTDQEYDKLKTDYGVEETKEAIKRLDEYIEMKGTKYKSHYLAMKKWAFDAVKENKSSIKQTYQVIDDWLKEDSDDQE